ncbi:MAG: DUF433 domain-containing protein [Chloroflexi bacterium]|nr:DUF433 domain-containing protein [Chloroflexota bacterium]
MAKTKRVKETKGAYTTNDARKPRTRVVKPRAQPKPALPKRRAPSTFIVTDPKICGGEPTMLGTQITVQEVLEKVATGESWDSIIKSLHGPVSKAALTEAVRLAARALQSKTAVLLSPSDQNDAEIYNRYSEQLNKEALDVLKYQVIP